MEIHDAVEGLALYPFMARLPGLDIKVGMLFDEHDELDRVLTIALAMADHGEPGKADWPTVLIALEGLAEHMDHEEHGLFPAAAVSLDPDDWDRMAAVRAGRLPDSGQQ